MITEIQKHSKKIFGEKNQMDEISTPQAKIFKLLSKFLAISAKLETLFLMKVKLGSERYAY